MARLPRGGSDLVAPRAPRGGPLLALAGAALLALLGAEVGVRLLDLPPRPLSALPRHAYRLSEDPILRYEYRPGHRATDEVWDPTHRGFDINSAGFRERELPLEKPPGMERIAVLGDSVTAGNGVEDEEALFTRLLERKLSEGRRGRRVEVLNFGVGGYQTLQEVETLRTKALAYGPDRVVLVVCLNDFHVGADGGVEERLLAERARLVDAAGGSLLQGWLELSRLAFFVTQRLRELRPSDQVCAYRARYLAGSTPVEVGLRQLQELGAANGLVPVVVLVPYLDRPFDAYPFAKKHEQVRQAAAAAGVEFHDLLAGFRAAEPEASSLSYDGLHLSERGHAVMAELLAGILDDRP